MKESTLWGHIDHPLSGFGKFQKISDRFTGGVPDVIGTCKGLPINCGPGVLIGMNGVIPPKGIPVAMELKELDGVRVLKTKFRPGQLDWLRDWELGGGVSLILASWGQAVFGFQWTFGTALEQGVAPGSAQRNCLFEFPKAPRGASWRDFVTLVLVPLLQEASKGPTPYSMVSGIPRLLRPDLEPLRAYSGLPARN